MLTDRAEVIKDLKESKFDSKKEEAKEVKETGEAKTKFTVPAACAESPEQAAPEEARSAPESKATKQQPVPDKDNESLQLIH